jgi:uncharacterized damage-inducible protein DinB
MKKSFLIILLFKLSFSFAQNASLKSVLLLQLKTTHNQKEWFVPVNTALEGLTPEQAMWKDSSGNHSIGQLANHLIFWNAQQLAKFKGLKPDAFSGNNEETFGKPDKKSWAATIQKLDDILTQLEKAIQDADEAKLQSWYSTIANISTHNAYHTGQIIYIRKLQGSWDPEKGVK